jgi:hypothetical protein
VIAPLGQLHHAPPAHVGIPARLLDVLAVALDVVEDEAFPQREIAQRDLGGAQPPENGVEQHGAGDDDVAALRLEARQLEPLLQAERDDVLADAVDLPSRNPQVAQLVWRPARFRMRGHRSEAENRARGSDDAIEASVDDLFGEAVDLAVDEPHELSLVARGERV